MLNPNNQYNINWTKYNRLSQILFLSSFYPKSQPLDIFSRTLNSTRSQHALPDCLPKITPGCNWTTQWKILRMVPTWSTNTNVPVTRYRLNVLRCIPQWRYGFKRYWSNWKIKLLKFLTFFRSAYCDCVNLCPAIQGLVTKMDWRRNNCRVDRIPNDILRSSSVFWLLTADCCLNLYVSLLEQCNIFIVVFKDYFAHTSMLWLHYSWHWYRGDIMPFPHVPGDNLPCIPVRYCVHVDEVCKHYAPDKNQATHRMISSAKICQMQLELSHHTIRLPQ